MMIRAIGIISALLSLISVAHADGIGQCVSACEQEAACSTPKCANLCEISCKQEITQPQHVFNGPVTSMPLAPCTSDVFPCGGFLVSGAVANTAFCPGNVTIYQICPDERGTSIIATGPVAADCTFGFTAPNGPGQNGCYGLIATAPPATIGGLPTTGGGDPGWATCTGAACPAP
jgi:hypothetical protein